MEMAIEYIWQPKQTEVWELRFTEQGGQKQNMQVHSTIC